MVGMTSTQNLTIALQKVIANAVAAGWTFEASHDQFVTLIGGSRRTYCIFLNAKHGFDHALAYRGENCLGTLSTLRQVTDAIAREG